MSIRAIWFWKLCAYMSGRCGEGSVRSGGGRSQCLRRGCHVRIACVPGRVQLVGRAYLLRALGTHQTPVAEAGAPSEFFLPLMRGPSVAARCGLRPGRRMSKVGNESGKSHLVPTFNLIGCICYASAGGGSRGISSTVSAADLYGHRASA